MATKIDKARRFANDFLRKQDIELSEEGAELLAQAILAFEEAAQQLRALEGGESAASQAVSTPEVSSTLQAEYTPTRRK